MLLAAIRLILGLELATSSFPYGDSNNKKSTFSDAGGLFGDHPGDVNNNEKPTLSPEEEPPRKRVVIQDTSRRGFKKKRRVITCRSWNGVEDG